MEFKAGDEVIANVLPPIMTITEIIGKKALCQWIIDGKKIEKKYFLTELKMSTELEKKKEKKKMPARKKKVVFRARGNRPS
jgi:uncharacterized protein YodC (DUF2158 family)